MNIYKVYDPDGKPEIFTTLADLRNFLGLSADDAKKCFYPGVHRVETGDEVITYTD